MSEKSRVLRWPSLRVPVDLLFFLCCILLAADVLVPELWGSGKTKDYPLWYWAGQQVLQGKDLYPSQLGEYFAFIYPPLPAVLLAIPAWFGKVALYACLSLLNIVAWWTTAQFSHAMTGSGRVPNQWLYFLPGFVTISFVFDMFDLGQPNLMLLALMLYGFWLMQQARPWLGGSMFALATAIKVFPVAVLPYLVWRRQWAAAASTIVFTLVFLFVVPAPVRGLQHNTAELKTWYQAMVGASSEKGFGQRDEQNWSWVNQSIIAMTHRLTRPVNYNQDDPSRPVRTMNVIDISFNAANLVVLVVCAVLGLAFVLVLPPEKKRTPRSDAEELGILFCLMTVASPLARQYYFIWLFFPMTVLMHRAAYDPRPGVRTGTWLSLALAGILLLLALPPFPKDIQAWGNNFAATVVMAVGLGWHLRHPAPRENAGPDGATELQASR
ncbi:MAG: glycosyltransferase family 87 protein [Bradyrhizobium sp.]